MSFVNCLFLQAPKLQRVLRHARHRAEGRATAPTPSIAGRLEGAVAFDHVSFSYDGKRDGGRAMSLSTSRPARRSRWSARRDRANRRRSACCIASSIPTRARSLIDGIDIRDMTLASLRRNIGVVFQEPMLFARSIEENLRVGKPDASEAEIAPALELRAGRRFRRAPERGPQNDRRRARPLALGRRAPAALDRARAPRKTRRS